MVDMMCGIICHDIDIHTDRYNGVFFGFHFFYVYTVDG